MMFTDLVRINPQISFDKGKYYPFVEMANVDFFSRSPKQIDEREYSSGVKFEKGDTVIARIEPCLQNGKGFYVNEISCGFGSTEFLVFRPNDGRVDNRFLYYFLMADHIRKSMIASMTGATGRQRVNLDIFRSMDVNIPPLSTQRHIAEILSAYDDLIENNQKQIKLLEEAAMRIYKEWFVHFRFPGHENTPIVDGVPEGWASCVLSDVIDFDPSVKTEKGKVKRTIPMTALSTRSMVIDEALTVTTTSNAGSKFRNNDTLLARITPCLENGKTAFVSFLDEAESAVGSTEFIVMRSKRLNPYLVYCIARSDNFRSSAINSMTGADGRQRVKTDKIKSFTFLLPDDEIIESSYRYMKPLFEKIQVLNKQCRGLRHARDKLLPKLMSGEIEV